jgi:hypothetical protein
MKSPPPIVLGERLLDIALNNLTLARVGLFRAILSRRLAQTLDLPNVPAAVNGFRDAGTMDYLPNGLLTAALYHFVRGEAVAARTALTRPDRLPSVAQCRSTSPTSTSTAPASFATTPNSPKPASSSKSTATGAAKRNWKTPKPPRRVGRLK